MSSISKASNVSENTNYTFLDNYEKMKQTGDLVGAFTNLLLYCNNEYKRIGSGADEDDLRNKFAELADLQNQIKSRVSSGAGAGNDDQSDSDRVTQFLLDPCFKKNCLLFKDVIGLENQKEQILESFAYPLLYPKLYPKGTKGMLFYGPPGTGKTYIMRATVNQLQVLDDKLRILYYAPTGAELKGKYVGETEKNIKAYFDVASDNAKECEKKNDGKKYISIIFIDEVEAIAGDRATSGEFMTNSVNTLLQMMDGVNSKDNVAIVAATNYPWNLDSAILRRLQKRIHIKLPSKNDIEKLMHYEIDNYLKFKSYIDEFDVPEFCNDPDRDNSCQKEVCVFNEKDGEFKPKYSEKDSQFAKYELIDYTALMKDIALFSSNCSGDPIDTQKAGKEKKNQTAPYSNSDVSNFMNNVFTNAASRVKNENFKLARIKDEIIYLYSECDIKNNINYNSIEEAVKKNPYYEIEYCRKIINLDDENERKYLESWCKENNTDIEGFIKNANNLLTAYNTGDVNSIEQAYFNIPPPPSKRKNKEIMIGGTVSTVNRFKPLKVESTKPKNQQSKGTSEPSMEDNFYNILTRRMDYNREYNNEEDKKQKLSVIKYNNNEYTNIKDITPDQQNNFNEKIKELLETNEESGRQLLDYIPETDPLPDEGRQKIDLFTESTGVFDAITGYARSFLQDSNLKLKKNIYEDFKDKDDELFYFYMLKKFLNKAIIGRGNIFIDTNSYDLLYTFQTSLLKKDDELNTNLSFNSCYGLVKLKDLIKIAFIDISILKIIDPDYKNTSGGSKNKFFKKTKKINKNKTLSNYKKTMKGGFKEKKIGKKEINCSEFKHLYEADEFKKILYVSNKVLFTNKGSEQKIEYDNASIRFPDINYNSLALTFINNIVEINGQTKKKFDEDIENFRKLVENNNFKYIFENEIEGTKVGDLLSTNPDPYLENFSEKFSSKGINLPSETQNNNLKKNNQNFDSKALLRNFQFSTADFQNAFENIKSSINPIEIQRLNRYDDTGTNPCLDDAWINEDPQRKCARK